MCRATRGAEIHLTLFVGALRGGAPPDGNKEDKSKVETSKDDLMKAMSEMPPEKLAVLAEFLAQLSTSTTSSTNDSQPQASLDSASHSKKEDDRGYGGKVDNPLGLNDFLSTHFNGIKICDSSLPQDTDKRLCLAQIFGRKGPKANALENKLSFFLMYDPTKLDLNEETKEWLWSEVVQNNTSRWVELLPEDEKNGWLLYGEDNIVCLHGDVMELRFGMVTKKTPHSKVKALTVDDALRMSHCKSVLLVHDTIVESFTNQGLLTSGSSTVGVSFDKGSFHATISFGEAISSVSWGDLMKQEEADTKETSLHGQKKCRPRRFKAMSKDSFVYEEDAYIDCYESGDEGNLLTACHEFKLFTQASNTGFYKEKFCNEVMRFGCACLNSRKNGTIHFGIADEKVEHATAINKSARSIVGMSYVNISDYKDKLTEAINNCFDFENREFARRCIGQPVLVKVESPNATRDQKYVIEVDIEPSYEYTRDKVFSVALYDLSKKKSNKMYEYYVRNGAQSSIKTCDECNEDIKRLDNKRKQEELQRKKPGNMVHHLHNILGVSGGKLDKDFKRILVLSNCEDSSNSTDLTNVQVLGNIHWSFVIDFTNNNKDTTGMCQILTEENEYEIHAAEDFDIELQEVGIPRAWVFGNGLGANEVQLPWEKWQLSTSFSGLEELVKKAGHEFPHSRTVILFLIRKGFSKIEALAYGKLLLHFGENVVGFYIEDEETEDEWMDYVVDDLRYIEKHKCISRGITGLRWKEFLVEIENLTMDFKKDTIKIPLSSRTLCSIKQNEFKDKTVSVMDSIECDHLYKLKERDREGYTKEQEEVQRNFYSGREASMKNIWFTEHGYDHIIERDVIAKLHTCIDYALSLQSDTPARIEIIRLLYSRGSGGTTAARLFLWRLFHHKAPFTCRCCIVNTIGQTTCKTINQLWTYENRDNLPVVALVDDKHDVNFEQLKQGLRERLESMKVDKRGVAVILLRVEACDDPLAEARKGDPELNVSMSYDLSDDEYFCFQKKYDDMKRTHGRGFEKTLPAFMMMIQSSSKERQAYAKSRVESTLPHLSETECNLLQYLSLLRYTVREERYIPIASLDPIMVSQEYLQQKWQVSWTHDISFHAKLFLRFTEIHLNPEEDPITGVNIVFLEFADEILTWAHHERERSVATIALDFMKSETFPPREAIPKNKEYVWCLYDYMYLALVCKRKQPEDANKLYFSTLIERILENDRKVSKKNIDAAIRVMSVGFEKMGSPVLAQQVARLCYKFGPSIANQMEIYFSTAETWIKKALSIKRNSFFLDTYGRIQLQRLKYSFPKTKGFKQHPRLTDDVQCLRAVDLGLDAIRWFMQSQKSEQTSKSLNTAGYCGEMLAMIFLLSILSNSKVFDYKVRNLQKYMCLSNWKPKNAPWNKEEDEKLKCFRRRYAECFRKVEEVDAILKIEDDVDAHEHYLYFREYFVFLDLNSGQSTDLGKFKENTMFVEKHIGGSMFRNVFNFHRAKNRRYPDDPENNRELHTVLSKISENLRLSVDDQLKDEQKFISVLVKMALYSPYGGCSKSKEQIVEEFETAKHAIECLLHCSSEQGKTVQNYCLLLSFMFEWPCIGHSMSDTENWLQKYEAKLQQLVSMSRKLQSRSEIPEDEFTHRKRRLSGQPFPNRSPVTTLFYLGKGVGLDRYVHLNELQFKARSRFSRQIMWDHPYLEQRLQRLTGKRISNDLIDWKINHKQTIKIKVTGQWRQRFSLEMVSFFVGFSWQGPFAFAVKPDDGKH